MSREKYAPWMFVESMIRKHLASEHIDYAVFAEVLNETKNLVLRAQYNDESSFRLAQVQNEIIYLASLVRMALLPKVTTDQTTLDRAVAALSIWSGNNLSIDELAQECEKKTG